MSGHTRLKPTSSVLRPTQQINHDLVTHRGSAQCVSSILLNHRNQYTPSLPSLPSLKADLMAQSVQCRLNGPKVRSSIQSQVHHSQN